MLGYSERGRELPSPMDPPWSKVDHVGIRIASGNQPTEELLAQGQRVVIYDPHRGTVPAFGVFTSDVYNLPSPEHGCEIAIRFRAEGWVPRSENAPKIGKVLGAGMLRKAQLIKGSYRGLTEAEYRRLADEIKASSGFESR